MSAYFSPDCIVYLTWVQFPDIPRAELQALRHRIKGCTPLDVAVALWTAGVVALVAQYPTRTPLERRRKRERTEWP